MALQNFVARRLPAISAAWLNVVDALKFTVFEDSLQKDTAVTALFNSTAAKNAGMVALELRQQVVSTGTDSGAANAAVVTLTGPLAAWSRVVGSKVSFAAAAVNTGAATLNVNGSGVVAILAQDGTACTGGELYFPVVVEWTGAAWKIVAGGIPLENRRTTFETSAAIVPTNYRFAPYDLPRYGALVDGVTNDGTAVRNWILAANAAGATARSSLTGIAHCSAFTTIATTDVVRIDAPGLTIRGPSPRVDFYRPGGNFFIKNVTLQQWLSAIEIELGDAGSITKALLENATIIDCDSIGLHIQRPVDDIRIINCDFSDCVDYGIRIGMDEGSIQNTWQFRLIQGCKISDIHGSGGLDVGGVLIYGHKAIITDCEISLISNTGAFGAWGIYTKCRYSVISSNIIYTVTTASNGDCVGISIKGAGRGGAPAGVEGYSVVVSDNQIFSIGTANNRGVGIRLQPDDILCHNNFIEEAGVNGIVCDQPGTNNICIQNCQILFNGSSAGRTGMSCSWNGLRHRALHNIVINAVVGLQLDAGGDLLIEGNEFNTTTSAIATNSGGTMDNVIIRGNRQRGAGSGWAYSAGTLTNWAFEDNEWNSFSGVIPKGTRIRHRRKVQTVDATVTTVLQFELPDNAALGIHAFTTGIKTDGTDRAMYGQEALIYRDGAGATLQGTVQQYSGVESNAAWNATIGTSANLATVVVQGVAATTIDWHVLVDIAGA